jgi:hypothetical protein
MQGEIRRVSCTVRNRVAEMSEQNILNPTITSALNPDYAVKITDAATVARYQARSGKAFFRRLAGRGQAFDLTWGNRLFSDADALVQWFHQYELDFFSFADYDTGRYYSGMFADQPQIERAGNNRVNITAQFIVVPGLAQFQYPSRWGTDSIFLEERASGNDLVKLTGTWDHGDKNYCLFSEQMDNAVWAEIGCTVVANSVTDPNGGATADAVTYSATGSSGQLRQLITRNIPIAGKPFTFSCFLKVPSGTQTLHLDIGNQSFAGIGIDAVCALTTAWQRFQVSGIIPVATTALSVIMFSPSAIGEYDMWGAQLETGLTATAYTQTTNAAAVLSAPNADANLHGGFAYADLGTNLTDAAEWKYFGYGFRLWSYKGPDMGIMQITLDGVVLGTVDLYAAAATASSVVFTAQSQVLADHRVKLSPTNTKNAASSGFTVLADAIEVMR